ncbi:MAG TPA: fluoride efflux transporter CrcB [Candidatus Baltobacteraceae bacterium]|nr:fluoride efflux transporter CrcB [Candidatus Baltobacteraceae bacterium]
MPSDLGEHRDPLSSGKDVTLIALPDLLSVALGGAIGSVLRFLVTIFVTQRMGPGFPFAVLGINVLGSFLIGLVAELSLSRAIGVTTEVRIFLGVGVLGGFTTFSTFSLDTLNLVRDGNAAFALLYVASSVIGGFAAAYAGTILARIPGHL